MHFFKKTIILLSISLRYEKSNDLLMKFHLNSTILFFEFQQFLFDVKAACIAGQ